MYIKARKIELPLSDFYSSLEKKNTSCVTEMDFTEDSNFLILASQRVTKDNVKSYIHGDEIEDIIFLVWDIMQEEILTDIERLKKSKEWATWTLSSGLYARY